MATLTKTQLKTPLELLYHWETQQAGKIYLSQPIEGQWHTWTWQETADEVRRMAAALQARGVQPGDKVGLMSRNCAHWVMADLAIMMSGAISVPIYPNVNAATVEYVLTHSEAKTLFVGKLEPSDWAEMQKGIPSEVDCISFGHYSLPDDQYPGWDEVIKEQAPMNESPTRDLEEVMTIIYTSGTTGKPKGVVQKFISPIFAIEFFYDAFELVPKDRFFSYLPLSHIAERMLIVMGTLRCGGSIHFAQSLDTFADNLKTCQPTVFLGVPRIWAKFQSGVFAKFSPSRLNLLLSLPFLGNVIKKKIQQALGLDQGRILLTGAAPIPVSLLEWYAKLNMNVYNVYGMTENCAYSHSNLPGASRFGTVGKPLRDVEMKLTEEGEICVKSLANMVEYYKEPEKTAETLRDGFLHTGDKGVVDADGFVRITGRVKDLFKTSKAKYVAPNPIEMKLSKNDWIEQVCVVGDGIPQPIALAVLTPEGHKANRKEVQAALEETLQQVNLTLEHHERLQKIVVVKEEWTPENQLLTPTLKIKRGKVDEVYQNRYEKWYDGGKGVIWE